MKKVYKHHMIISFGGFSGSDIKWRLSYRQSYSQVS